MIARAGALCLALVAGLGGTALAARLPVDGAVPGTAAAGARLELPAATTALVCPGPETAVVPEGATAEPAPGPYSLAAVAAGPGRDAAALAGLATEPAAAGAAGRLAGTGPARVATLAAATGSQPLRLAPATAPGAPAPGAGADAPVRLAAAQTTLARTGDLRGLTAGTCEPAAASAWIVGGDATPGRRARLLLTNPTPAPAVVDVRVAGRAGPVDVPSARGIVVPPGKVRAVPLEALAPGAGPLAVHVVARSGRVTALLHDTWLRGAVPGGTDDAVPGPAPARRLVVPGLVVPPGGTARLRVAAPGDAEAVVRFRLVGPTGDVARPAPGVVTVPAGGVAEVPLNGLAPGAYTASLEADTPVVAAAALTVAGPARGPLRTVSTEFAWTGATAPLSGDVVGAVPRPAEVRRGVLTRPPARAALVLGGSAVPVEMQLREVDAAGKALLAAPATVRVPAGRTVVVGLAAATAGYVLAVPASTPIHAALVVTLDDPAGQLLTALPVRPAVVASRVAPPAVEDPAVVGR